MPSNAPDYFRTMDLRHVDPTSPLGVDLRRGTTRFSAAALEQLAAMRPEQSAARALAQSNRRLSDIRDRKRAAEIAKLEIEAEEANEVAIQAQIVLGDEGNDQ